MACFSPDGLPPNPPRVWNRFQNRCSTERQTNVRNPIVFYPYTNEFLPVEIVTQRERMMAKGNVLQYKKNSSDITRKQRYAQIQKGKWVNRNKTFGSQTVTVTDPNTDSLKRVNFTTIYADDGTPAFEPVTCPEKTITSIPKELPPNTNPSFPPPPQPPLLPDLSDDPNIINSTIDPFYPQGCPQYIDPRNLAREQPIIPIPKKRLERKKPKKVIEDLPIIKPPVPEPERVVIPDGGQLVCENDELCLSDSIKGRRLFQKPNYCNPTTDSDVPGPIQDLCYNSLRLRPYYPRQRYKMPVSGNKFPTGYKFQNN